MGSRKEEERNEKIIRGLMKLPPNRRCINCNSLGPQYVCTNFWTFVCMTCSGIHREFTHRVKSVSMSKFTSQEVESLQNGGNQRAREMYLKDWDFQRQRLPDNSNVDRIREFIKNVYVDRRYAGGKTSEKPPRDMQSLRNREDETRRASSYHSYSQSPPYDYQYEDRRYGKSTASLSRKPGSDRGRYEGKLSSFVSSPSRLSDQIYEERFANEGSVSRISDYSVSSGGDLFRSGVQSPTFQDGGFNSSPFQSISDARNSSVDESAKRDADGIPRPQRTALSSSFGSIDRNTMSAKSHCFDASTKTVLEPDQVARTDQDKLPTFEQPSVPGISGSVNLFEEPFAPKLPSSAASTIDLFQPPAGFSAPLDLFQPSVISASPSMAVHQPPQTSPPTSFFAASEKIEPVLEVPKNEGWATFDTPKTTTVVFPGTDHFKPAKDPFSEGNSFGKFEPFSSVNTTIDWPPFQNYNVHGHPLKMDNQWNDVIPSIEAPAVVTSGQTWNAFEDSRGHQSLENFNLGGELQELSQRPSTVNNLGLGVSQQHSEDGFSRASGGPPHPDVTFNVVTGPTFNTPLFPSMEEPHPRASDWKSSNPFDLPYDSDVKESNMFLDMSSLENALPNAQVPSTFLGGSQTWFPQNPLPPFLPAPGPGNLSLMAGQATGSPIPTVTTQEPVASIGGNPFA